MIKVTMTWIWCMKLHNPKTHSHTQFGIPTSKNIEDKHQHDGDSRNKARRQGHIDPRMVCDTPSCQDASTQQL